MTRIERSMRHGRRSERGQTTAEYAMVLIAAATIAMLIVAWAADTGAIGGSDSHEFMVLAQTGESDIGVNFKWITDDP